jgi:hypothetical protein
MAQNDYTEPTDGVEPPPETAPPPAPEPQPEPDPALQGWEELRRRRPRSQQAAPNEPPPGDGGGLGERAEELGVSGWVSRMQDLHRAERERARQDAISGSERAVNPPPRTPPPSPGSGWWMEGTELYPGANSGPDYFGDALREAPTWIAEHVLQLPGSLITGTGSLVASPDVVAARAELAEQHRRLRHLGIAGRIDRGEPWQEALRERPGAIMDRRYLEFARNYAAMGPDQRVAERDRLIAEVASFAPTPIAERELFQTGQWLQGYGRNLVGHFEGYDEQSVAVQLSRGLGSMIVGMAGGFAGGAGRLAIFGGMGIGEAAERAVQFDRAERAAGRAGITHEQIVLAGLLGVGPGATDILPVENLLHSLRVPGMTPRMTSTLARFISQVGGRAFIQAATEGGQEGLQQFLQNLIARQVYNPNQALGQDVPGSMALGFAVGAEASVLLNRGGAS